MVKLALCIILAVINFYGWSYWIEKNRYVEPAFRMEK